MKRYIIRFTTLMVLFASIVSAQTADKEKLLEGINFIDTHTYSIEENEAILKLFKELRAADVSAGLDMVGLSGTGLVDRSIHPLWKDLDSFAHRICGIAVTVRYVPTQRPALPGPDEEFTRWEGSWYTKLSSEAFTSVLSPGNVIVIDDVEEADIGSIGSNNIMGWYEKGAVGVVTDASSRDTDEVAKQRIPLYLRHVGRGIRPGRNEIESVNRPVEIGGVLVCPGDVVIADGDGVVVVPRKVAEQVAIHAHRILVGDKKGRRNLYERLGIPLDQTVK